mmetsp:Transcript_7395/g.20445  ORF Transcript_7395/g.20445 Transcript_7395/m.20445 type:complete len:232 (-) Transcript_7395:522-1217(-)
MSMTPNQIQGGPSRNRQSALVSLTSPSVLETLGPNLTPGRIRAGLSPQTPLAAASVRRRGRGEGVVEVPLGAPIDTHAVLAEVDRQPHVARVEQGALGAVAVGAMDPIVGHVDEVRRALGRRVLHHVRGLRVERRGATGGVPEVHPTRVVEGLALRAIENEGVGVPPGEVRRDHVVGAVLVPEERHALEDRVGRDQPAGVEVVRRQPGDPHVLVVHRPDEVGLPVNGILEQ